jgi:excisionase family DNA binding protein
MSAEKEKWTSIEEIAEHIQVHKDTIRIWIKKGEIPAHKIGKQWRFKISEIDEWVQSGKSANINNSSD